MWEELGQIGEVAASVAQAPVWSLSDEQLCSHLDQVHAAEQALAAARLHLVAEIGGRDVPARQGVASTGSWLVGRLHVAANTATRWVEVAGHVTRRPALDGALVAGAVNVHQAKVIGTAVAALPATQLGPPIVDKAEATLVAFAADHEPQALAKMGRRILWHVAPEVAEKVYEAALRREEDRANITRALTLTPTGDGRTRITSNRPTRAGRPAWTTAASGADTITGWSTTKAGRSDSEPTEGPSSFHPPMWTPSADPGATSTTDDHSQTRLSSSANGVTRNASTGPAGSDQGVTATAS